MGEAKKRRDAMAAGEPLAKDRHRCPTCRGFRTKVAEGPVLALSHVPTRYGICADCKTLWEALPDDWRGDVVEAEPCDNCAFRAGSPESQDKEGWHDLLSKLQAGTEFVCHKGCPILFRPAEDSDGETAEFDAAWLKQNGRWCAGFGKAVAQWPDWLKNRYPELRKFPEVEG